MLNLVLLTELSRQRQHNVARDVALCRYVCSPRVLFGRTLVALGALAVCIGSALEESPRDSVAFGFAEAARRHVSAMPTRS